MGMAALLQGLFAGAGAGAGAGAEPGPVRFDGVVASDATSVKLPPDRGLVSAIFGNFKLSQHPPAAGGKAEAISYHGHLEIAYPPAARGKRVGVEMRALWNVFGAGAAATLTMRIGGAVHAVPPPVPPEEASEFRVELDLASDGETLRIEIDAAIPPIETPGDGVFLSVESVDVQLNPDSPT